MRVAEVVERKLYDAALKGQVITLEELQKEDPLIHHGLPFAGSRSLLHVATLYGQASIVEQVLEIDPRLARILDSQRMSPLHIAVAEGNLDITRKLLSLPKSVEMCWLRDDEGMNPVHIAAMKGHVEILEELLQQGLLPAMERVHRGQTVLHLCLKHRQLPAFVALVEKLGDLVCAEDDDGDTVLHLAVRSNQVEIIFYLAMKKKIKKLTKNSMGKTAYDLLDESPPGTILNFLETADLLIRVPDQSKDEMNRMFGQMLMVVMILIATMAFQAVISPPGGVWQDDTSSHRAGESVMASTHPQVYKHFKRANTTAFISSILVIFITGTGLTLKSLALTMYAMGAMWVALASIAVSYGASIMVITPSKKAQSFAPTILTVSLVCAGIYVFMLGFHAIRQSFSKWKITKRQLQGDYIARRLHHRFLYSIFEGFVYTSGMQD